VGIVGVSEEMQLLGEMNPGKPLLKNTLTGTLRVFMFPFHRL
jgi:hypothetical protein